MLLSGLQILNFMLLFLYLMFVFIVFGVVMTRFKDDIRFPRL